jgi:hypothetical protein
MRRLPVHVVLVEAMRLEFSQHVRPNRAQELRKSIAGWTVLVSRLEGSTVFALVPSEAHAGTFGEPALSESHHATELAVFLRRPRSSGFAPQRIKIPTFLTSSINTTGRKHVVEHGCALWTQVPHETLPRKPLVA